MTYKELSTTLIKFHQLLENYGRTEGVFYDEQWQKNFSVPLNACAARVETYVEYLSHPLWSALNRMAGIDIENYKVETLERFRGKLNQFLKEATHLPLRARKLCSKLLSELDSLD